METMKLNLSALSAGSIAVIVAMNLDSRNRLKCASLGIRDGAVVSVHKAGNPLLINVAGTQVAIGQSIAGKILVEKTDVR